MSHVVRLAIALLLAVACSVRGQPPSGTERGAPVPVTGGLVSGLELPGGLRVFKGVPYAEPPTGDLRWRAPRPPAAWADVRACEAFGPACPQPERELPGRDPGIQSEDCLYLNVWTSAREAVAPGSAGLPVMVWIHGGGFSVGSGALPFYDGAALASRGVVVITFNYRLGPFGFLAHPGLSQEAQDGVSGNYGLLDQIAALRWVRDNARAFGGDPGKVTIFGESAGGVAVCWLLATPSACGLFQRAIAQSGTAQRSRALRGEGGAEATGVEIAAALGCDRADDPVAALRAVSSEALLQASRPAVGLLARGNKFGPVMDGVLVPEAPEVALAAGRQAPVPLLVGANADDGATFVPRRMSKLVYRVLVRRVFGRDAPRILKRYDPGQEGGATQALAELLTDSAFGAPARLTARAVAASGQSAWLYLFSRVPPGATGRQGARHGLEIPYVFGNLGQILGLSVPDRELSDTMADTWTRFARTGDPNGPGLVTWPVCPPKGPAPVMEFGTATRVLPGWRTEALDLQDEIRGRMIDAVPPGMGEREGDAGG